MIIKKNYWNRFWDFRVRLCYSLNNDDNNVHYGHFDGQAIDNKILNEIILDDELKNILAFGNDCISFLCTKHEFKFHHFKNIKMNLYKRIYKIKASNSNKEVNIEYIIKLILIEAKKKAIDQIKLTYPNLKENDIHYVITVPAIWDINSKQIMINASQEAGLIREDDNFSNFFALEPEAASIYFAHDCSHKKKKELNIEDKKETSFILCDYGSGTVDIVTQKKTFDENNQLPLHYKRNPLQHSQR